MFTPAETISLVTALGALAVAWRAYLISKDVAKVQEAAHLANQHDVAARQEPKLQVSNETFLASWFRTSTEAADPEDEKYLEYSAVITNKGDSVAAIESYVIELGVAPEAYAAPRPGFGVHVAGPLYLAAGETFAISTTVTQRHLDFVRLFCQLEKGIVVCSLVIRYSGYASQRRIRRVEIGRFTVDGGWISIGSVTGFETKPRSYIVTPT